MFSVRVGLAQRCDPVGDGIGHIARPLALGVNIAEKRLHDLVSAQHHADADVRGRASNVGHDAMANDVRAGVFHTRLLA